MVGTFGAREPVEASRFDCLFDGFEIDGPHPSAEPEEAEAEAEAGGGGESLFSFRREKKIRRHLRARSAYACCN